MVWGQNVREIFGESLHRTDRLVYRLLTLHFVRFLTKINTRQLLQLLTAMVAYTDGIRMLRFWNFLHCVPTDFVCVFVGTQINLIAYSRCFNWVNRTLFRAHSHFLLLENVSILLSNGLFFYMTIIIFSHLAYLYN